VRDVGSGLDCSGAFRGWAEVQRTSVTLLDDYEQHSSVLAHIAAGYEALWF